jgi:antitoxin component of MazEF toxin-antitoxin module
MKLQYDKNEQYKLTLPKSLLNALRWKKGDNITIALENEKLVLINEGNNVS